MGKDLRTTIREINKGKNIKENIPVYAGLMQKAYVTTAALHLAMDYETLFDQIFNQENIAAPLDVKETFLHIEGYLRDILERKDRSCLDALLSHRDCVTEKMEVLTACVDRLSNAEYVYNRRELDFTGEAGIDISVSDLTAELMQFIVINKDNTITNERIRQVLGQLPVRIGRGRFYELVKNSLELYKDGDEAAVSSILYVLRTSGNLYHSEGMDKYFAGLQRDIEEIENIDYSSISGEDYENAGKKLKEISEEMLFLSDSYLSIQTIINEMISLCLLWDSDEEILPEKIEAVLKEESRALSNFKGDDSGDAFTKAIASIENLFVSLEGIQEENMEKQNLLEAVLDEAYLAGSGEMKEKLNRLLISQRLLGSSQFADIKGLMNGEAEECAGKISGSRLKEISGQLISEFDAYFKAHSQGLNRAVMARVLSHLPVFFTKLDEVEDYIESSLLQCRDESERKVSMELLLQLIDS